MSEINGKPRAATHFVHAPVETGSAVPMPVESGEQRPVESGRGVRK